MVHALLPAVHLRGPDPDLLPQHLEIAESRHARALARRGVQLTLLPVLRGSVLHRVVELHASQEPPRLGWLENLVEGPLAARSGCRSRA